MQLAPLAQGFPPGVSTGAQRPLTQTVVSESQKGPVLPGGPQTVPMIVQSPSRHCAPSGQEPAWQRPLVPRQAPCSQRNGSPQSSSLPQGAPPGGFARRHTPASHKLSEGQGCLG